MSEKKESQIVIIGAGIAGCFLAILLAKRGYRVTIYERSSLQRIQDAQSKKSFNLTFHGYGVKALQEADLFTALKPHLIPLAGSITQVLKSSAPPILMKPPRSMPYYAISRAKVMEVLIQQAKLSPLITFHFETELISIDKQKKTMVTQGVSSKKSQTVPFDVIFGADGVNSVVRTCIQQQPRTKLKKEYAPWVYKQILFDEATVKKLRLQTNVMYSFTGKQMILTAFPNTDNSISTMLILPTDPKTGFKALATPSAIEIFIGENFPNFLPALPEITKALLENPEGYFVTIYTEPWYYEDVIALIGDSAHGLFPFSGQGISAAFGDCLILMELMDSYKDDWRTIFPLYQDRRKRHTDAIADLSKDSFLHYRRDKKADYEAIYYKLESVLHSYLPGLVHPPPFSKIANDPTHAADYVQKHAQQRKKAALIGVPLAVKLVTGIVALQEIVTHIIQKNHQGSRPRQNV